MTTKIMNKMNAPHMTSPDQYMNDCQRVNLFDTFSTTLSLYSVFVVAGGHGTSSAGLLTYMTIRLFFNLVVRSALTAFMLSMALMYTLPKLSHPNRMLAQNSELSIVTVSIFTLSTITVQSFASRQTPHLSHFASLRCCFLFG